MAVYSNYENYIKKAENGARTNFDYRQCRLLDVQKDDTTSYFLLFFPDGEEAHYMELTTAEAFDLLATYHHAKVYVNTQEENQFYEIMDHCIEEILYGAKEEA